MDCYFEKEKKTKMKLTKSVDMELTKSVVAGIGMGSATVGGEKDCKEDEKLEWSSGHNHFSMCETCGREN